MGNLFRKMRPIGGFLDHLRNAITEIAAIENSARQHLSAGFRSFDFSTADQVAIAKVIHDSFKMSAGEVDKEKWSSVSNAECLGEYERICTGELKAMVKNNLIRVLVKRFRYTIQEQHARLRPLYNLVKLTMGPMGNWAKGI